MTLALQIAFDSMRESSVFLASTNAINNLLEAVCLRSLPKEFCGFCDTLLVNKRAPSPLLLHRS